jgi:hypothetical protein
VRKSYLGGPLWIYVHACARKCSSTWSIAEPMMHFVTQDGFVASILWSQVL